MKCRTRSKDSLSLSNIVGGNSLVPTGTSNADAATTRTIGSSVTTPSSSDIQHRNDEPELPQKRMRKAPQRFGDFVMDISN